MKTRNGWVSNSSSSSFVIRNDSDKKELEYKFPNVETFSVEDGIIALKLIEDIPNMTTDEFRFYLDKSGIRDETLINFFIEDLLYMGMGWSNEIEALEEVLDQYPDSLMTESIDRDSAFKQGLSLKAFLYDL
jgi:hypothetical protein